ncbi:Arm DNA-binding domain-containing protein, partial [Stutzerimonas stutzeri]|uniref:Arm DNA-binding domain-containing protein n=1 Tax=Stutzerimonas stutzeri TaxID=316 RepID=UPI003D317218
KMEYRWIINRTGTLPDGHTPDLTITRTILAEIKEGRFDYATHFPESPRAAAFSGIGGPSINRTVHEGLGRWLEVQRAKKASSTVSA